MTQEDKELLLKDLCARLPYRIKVYVEEDLAMTLKQIDYECFCEAWENEDFKCHSRWMFPYLRPMSSMTEEEHKYFQKLAFPYDFVDALNKHHFDYRGLIEKGLAIEASEGMYN